VSSNEPSEFLQKYSPFTMTGGAMMHSIITSYLGTRIWILGASLWSQVIRTSGIVERASKNTFTQSSCRFLGRLDSRFDL